MKTPVNVAITGAAGQTSGTLPIAFDFTADTPGAHTLEAWVVDGDGQESNRVSATTADVKSADTTPSLSNLEVEIGEVFVGLEKSVAGTVTFTDGDANLTTLVVSVKDLDVGQSIYARDLKLPDGVKLMSLPDIIVATCRVLAEVKTTEQIEADRYLAGKKAVQKKGLGILLKKLVPSGTD